MTARTLCAAGLALALLSSCQDSKSVVCSSGTICPAGTACDEARSGCIDPERLAACRGADDGAPCSYPGTEEGICRQGACFPVLCGNGDLDPLEVCDDGNTVNGDGCAADCGSDESCGNGVVDINETCDDGNTSDGDGCRGNCILPLCGDGVVDDEFLESCDDGDGNSDAPDATCRTNCLLARCGDGIVDSGETCDDGNFLAADGCSPDCASLEICGNGIVDHLAGEDCDDGALMSGDGCSSLCAQEYPTWTREGPSEMPARIEGGAAVFDVHRGLALHFGGIDDAGDAATLEYRSYWTRRHSAQTPTGRRDHAMAYDVGRRRAVLFGGRSAETGLDTKDTWEWDGLRWIPLAPETSPPPLAGHGMVYDAGGALTVLFGGTSDGSMKRDTWQWDGTGWTKIASTGPSARRGHAMGYDPVRGRVVVHGGFDAADEWQRDTWEWDGTGWVEITTAAAPGAPSPVESTRASMAWHVPMQALLLLVSSEAGIETWAWNGSQWKDLSAIPSPNSTRYQVVGDGTTGQVLAIPEAVGTATPNRWTGSVWEPEPFAQMPDLRYNLAGAYDARRGQTVILGQDATTNAIETWFWNLVDGWTRVESAQPDIAPQSMVYERAAGTMLIHSDTSTWRWSGASWSDVTPTAPEDSPPTRNHHPLAYDSVRDRVVIYGGRVGGPLRSDTWEWNGSIWIQRFPVTIPGSRYWSAMSYDPVRQRTVLFGGNGSWPLGDTHEWDGNNWADVTPPGSPGGRWAPELAWHANRQRTLLFGGWSLFDDTWEWDGTNWTLLAIAGESPGPRDQHAMLYHAPMDATLVFSGTPEDDWGRYRYRDLWSFRYQADARETCTTGLDADGDDLIGCDDPDCWPYCNPLCEPGTSCDSAWPHCGDGVCDEIESCRVCPADCGACTASCGDHICEGAESATSCPGDC